MRLLRRHVRVGVVASTLVAAVALTAVLTGGDPAAANKQQAQDQDQLARGRELYLTGCSSCHGVDAEGVEAGSGGRAFGPSLVEVGELGAYFMLSTGRMPMADPNQQPTRKETAYSDEDIDALVAYVGSLGNGPDVPAIDPDDADLAAGGVIYRANCQACHSASGSGGALSYGRAAPRLSPAEPEQVASAVRLGPGQMPVFDQEIISDEELNDLARYVRYLRNPADPGGLPIGRTGPIPEGFVAWMVGMVALVGFVVWIGTRSPVLRSRRRHEP